MKLNYFCHEADTEIGGFGISSKDDPLYIEDFVTIAQDVTAVTVAFRDKAVADYVDDCVDQGLHPSQFMRIWIHTHPGASVTPSSVDEETFARVFGDCDWAVMAILGRTGNFYARLRFNSGPGSESLIPMQVDWADWRNTVNDNAGSYWLDDTIAEWATEFDSNIHEVVRVWDIPERKPAKPGSLRITDSGGKVIYDGNLVELPPIGPQTSARSDSSWLAALADKSDSGVRRVEDETDRTIHHVQRGPGLDFTDDERDELELYGVDTDDLDDEELAEWLHELRSAAAEAAADDSNLWDEFADDQRPSW